MGRLQMTIQMREANAGRVAFSGNGGTANNAFWQKFDPPKLKAEPKKMKIAGRMGDDALAGVLGSLQENHSRDKALDFLLKNSGKIHNDDLYFFMKQLLICPGGKMEGYETDAEKAGNALFREKCLIASADLFEGKRFLNLMGKTFGATAEVQLAFFDNAIKKFQLQSWDIYNYAYGWGMEGTFAGKADARRKIGLFRALVADEKIAAIPCVHDSVKKLLITLDAKAAIVNGPGGAARIACKGEKSVREMRRDAWTKMKKAEGTAVTALAAIFSLIGAGFALPWKIADGASPLIMAGIVVSAVAVGITCSKYINAAIAGVAAVVGGIRHKIEWAGRKSLLKEVAQMHGGAANG